MGFELVSYAKTIADRVMNTPGCRAVMRLPGTQSVLSEFTIKAAISLRGLLPHRDPIGRQESMRSG